MSHPLWQFCQTMSSRRSFLSLLAATPLALLSRAREQAEPDDEIITLVDPDPHTIPGLITPWEGDPDTLARWRRAPRRLILENFDALSAHLLLAIKRGEPVEVVYEGGSLPFGRRTISPGALFEVEGFPGHYVSGYCHTRHAERTFLLSRLRLADLPDDLRFEG